MRIGSLFTGYGGLDMAVANVTGATTAWVSDIDKGACKILAHRYPDAPNLGDIAAVDWPAVEPVDILTGGFPCQDVSPAGKRAGIRPGTRSGLWTQMAYAINQLQPKMVVIENVRGLLSADAHSVMEPCAWCLGDRPGQSALRALGAVLGDLASLGYDARWGGLRAADAGAAHSRFRVFVVAYPDDSGWSQHRRPLAVRPEHSPAQHAGTGVGLSLLPTPNVFHMGNTETPDEWLERRADVQARTGTRHGPALGVVAQSIEEGSPLVQDGDGPRREPAPGFGAYAAAIGRWERILGRAAPAPTDAGKLSAAFTEWLMGLPAGWVTDVPGLSRNEALKACGNGVVPQQAELALHHLLAVPA